MTNTNTDTYPTQLHLPGQAAAPEGPVDMQIMYVMHHGFRRDLAKFGEAVRKTPVDARDTWALLHERWELFAEVLHHHHRGEDAGLWPWLMERASIEDQATLVAMEAEHAEIDPLLESCAEGFKRLAAVADEDARAALAVKIIATRDSLSRHLAHEETDAIALIQTLMTQDDWLEVEEKSFKSEKPSLSQIARSVPWAVSELPREARERVFREVGLPFWIIWRLTRRSFAKKEQRAFAHV